MDQARFVIQWDTFPSWFCTNMCQLMENQILVDLTLICNSYSLKVHKCVMAANSNYFKENLMKDSSIDRIIINGVSYRALKSLVEFLYCGETAVLEEDLQELVSSAKFFEVRGLDYIKCEKLLAANTEMKERPLSLKPPVFLSKNDKFKSFNRDTVPQDTANREKSVKIVLEGPNFYETDQKDIKISPATNAALAKEEEASRLALEMIQKDMTGTNLFVLNDQYGNGLGGTVQPLILGDGVKNIKGGNNIIDIIQENDSAEANKTRLEEYSTDISLVNVTNDVLKSLVESGAIQYEVISDDTQENQYICDFPIQAPKMPEKPCDFTQLVAQTLTNFENSSEHHVEFQDYIINEKLDFPNSPTVENISGGTSLVEDSYVETPTKKKRGRPPKRSCDDMFRTIKDEDKEGLLTDEVQEKFIGEDGDGNMRNENEDLEYIDINFMDK